LCVLSRFHRGEAERREVQQQREAERREAERREAERREAERREAERREAELQREAKAAAEELRRRATALGLLQVLTIVNIADDATLKKSIAFCDEQGVTSVSDMVEYDLVDDFVRHLGLKNVPGQKLRSALQPPTSRRAQISNRQISNRLAEWSSWLVGPPVAENKAADEKARRAERYRIALQKDGFALKALLPETDKSMLQSLEALLKPEHPKWLGKGKDVSKTYGPYDSLKFACAWKVDHPDLRSKYTAGVERVQRELKQLENRGKNVTTVPGLPVKTDRVRGFAPSEALTDGWMAET
jgi:hypothetical protein